MSIPYAYACTDCGHMASKHTWNPDDGGSLTEGPYVCPCGCVQVQDGNFVPLTQKQHSQWVLEHA